MKFFGRNNKIPKGSTFTAEERLKMIDKLKKSEGFPVELTENERNALVSECAQYGFEKGASFYAIIMGGTMLIMGLIREGIDWYQNRRKRG